MSRRTWMYGTSLVASLLLLMGCSGRSEDSPATSAAHDGRGGEATVLLAANLAGSWPAGLEPATNTTGGANISMMNAIFGGLFQLTADADGSNARIVGVLAKGYAFADEGKTLLIHLREGLQFSDGTPLDAQAVRFNVERSLATHCTCAPTRWPWAEKERVTVKSERTVALRFSRPSRGWRRSSISTGCHWNDTADG